MTTPTDQFVDIANRSQEAVTTAVHNWADTVQSFASKLTAGQSQLPDLHERRRPVLRLRREGAG